MEKSSASCSAGLGGTLSLNPQSRAIAKKTFHCNVAQMHLDSCATENDPAASADAGENACKNAGAVRVVQIFNPVLVKTDVANFRLLVQKLTGKSGCSKDVWNKLRRLNYVGAAMDDAVDVQLQELHVLGGAGVEQCMNEAADPAYGGDVYNTIRSDHEQSSINIAGAGGGAGGGAFSELDIYAGLVSDGPLPDITMLPPLVIHTRSELSLCT